MRCEYECDATLEEGCVVVVVIVAGYILQQ